MRDVVDGSEIDDGIERICVLVTFGKSVVSMNSSRGPIADGPGILIGLGALEAAGRPVRRAPGAGGTTRLVQGQSRSAAMFTTSGAAFARVLVRNAATRR